VTPTKLQDRITNQPKAWWQRAIAGGRLPNPVFRRPKCEGTVEDHRAIALDVRELIRKHVFEQPAGSIFRPSIAFPWLRVLRLESSSLDLELATGRTVTVPLVWASCGVVGERVRLECPLCGRRVCTLYHLEGRVACRHCNNLCYAAQRISSTARKFLIPMLPGRRGPRIVERRKDYSHMPLPDARSCGHILDRVRDHTVCYVTPSSARFFLIDKPQSSRSLDP
jgi:hypothetical protein